MTVILETSPGVWTEYASGAAAARAHGLGKMSVYAYLDHHGSGAGWYARRVKSPPIAGVLHGVAYPSIYAAAKANGMFHYDARKAMKLL